MSCTGMSLNKRERVSSQVSRYEGQHAFMNAARPEVYSPEMAKVAYERVFQFLEKTL